jgi:hypothetical protein
MEFSYVITNVGNKDVTIPGNHFANVIGVNYGWETISDSAKRTKVTPGIVRFGNAVAARGAKVTPPQRSPVASGRDNA